ncbi:ATP-binding protein [Amycolatopsis sp.]|uniref:ATP-binding protein n=1 Tax=Amycolatopsis sp. TaxID=37632 RepID=UPI002D7FC679|nr:tetratricopeptide repeat protein [Amycolatopsis sp.]HET6705566.1 tetratricopeptide repeat protein [Amycolatopsis sp.]
MSQEQPLQAGAAVQNTVAGTALSGSVVQAHTITGGVHHYHPAAAASPVPRQLLAVPHGFVGRVEQLAELDSHASGNSGGTPAETGRRPPPPPVISVIGGAGGMGKTWLALTWAHRNLDRFPDGQLFADLRGFGPAGGPAPAIDVLGGFLDALGVALEGRPADLDRRAGLYRSLVAGKRMLILLDNAATTDQVTPLLPGGHRCTVLITSRNQLQGLITRHGARPVHVTALTDAEAASLLAASAGADRAVAEAPAIAKLIAACGGFPLALGLIAARVVSDPRLPIRDVVADLRTWGLDALDSEEPTAGLSTVLSWSLHRLSARQRHVFALLGIAPGPEIGLPAAAGLAGLSERQAHAVLRALAESSLIDRLPGRRYGMHDLVRAYATTVAGTLSTAVRETALRRVLDFYTHTAQAADRVLDPHHTPIRLAPPAPGSHLPAVLDPPSALAWFDTEHPCLLAAHQTAAVHGWHESVWQLAWGLDTFLLWRGHRHDQVTVWQAAADAADHLADPVVPMRAHRYLGRALADLGRHDEALVHLQRALSAAERQHDPGQQAHTHRALATAWAGRADHRRALDHARRALALYRRLELPVWEADAFNQAGRSAARLGHFETAREYCRSALALARDQHDPIGEAKSLNNLGYIDHHSGDHNGALDRGRQALGLFRDLGHTFHTADTLDQLGHPHVALGQLEQARAVWQEAVELYTDQGRHDHAARVQQELGNLGHVQGRGGAVPDRRRMRA